MPALIFLLLAVFAFPVHAWNAAGHRIVAAIAWAEMSPVAQQEAGRLLAAHPDYRRWQTSGSGNARDRQIFIEAATWADDIRGDPRYFDDQNPPHGDGGAGSIDWSRHRNWHYVDFHADGSERKDGQLDIQLERLIGVLSNRKTPPSERSYALPWVIHLLGDIHQPLHVGSHNDEGGNRVMLEDPDNPRLPLTNLHRWWDDLPGPPWLRGHALDNSVAGLMNRTAKRPAQGNIHIWLRESLELGRFAAYPPTSRITAQFRQQARVIADERLVAAGIRLGRLLEHLLSKVPRETATE